jgi:hypothetical protein
MSTIQTNSLQTLAGQTMNTVLQVVHFDYGTFQTFTAGDGVAQDTGLVASITPRFASSRILVQVSANMSENSNATVCRGRITRTGPGTAFSAVSGTTNMTQYTAVVYAADTTNYMRPNANMIWFDTPNSTGTCTYRLQIASNGASQTVQLNGQRGYTSTWGGVSHMTLMEIAQ